MEIVRHECGLAYSRLDDEIEYFHTRIARGPQQDPSKVRTRAAAIGHGVELGGMLSIKDAKDRGIVDALRVTSRAGVALFAPLGAESDVEVEFWEGTKRMLPPLAPTPSAGADEWLWAAYAAMALRDEYALGVLSTTDLGLTRQQISHLVADARAHQGYLRADDDAAALVVQALSLNVAEQLPEIYRDLIAEISRPTLEVLHALVSRDEAGFNEQLESALVLHKKHWSTHSERKNDPTGMIALPLLALSCWAHDAGMTVDVVSDYIPGFIVENAGVASRGG